MHNGLKYISRSLYNGSICCRNDIKAIAMYIYVKHNCPCSVIKDFTYKKLQDITGLSVNTLKKRMHTLKELGLVERTGRTKRNILFKRCRSRYSNICISRYDMSSVESIEIGLMASLIVEIQNRKAFVEQCIKKAQRKSFKSLKQFKSAKSSRNKYACGIREYHDDGITYDYLAKNLSVGYGTISRIIQYGESQHMFTRERRIVKVGEFHNANQLLEFSNPNPRNMFANKKGTCLYVQLANKYKVIPDTRKSETSHIIPTDSVDNYLHRNTDSRMRVHILPLSESTFNRYVCPNSIQVSSSVYSFVYNLINNIGNASLACTSTIPSLSSSSAL